MTVATRPSKVAASPWPHRGSRPTSDNSAYDAGATGERFASVVAACTARTRPAAVVVATGSGTKTMPNRLPSSAGTGSPRRRSTGTITRTSTGVAPSASSQRRRPPATAARSASLTLTPSRPAASLTRARSRGVVQATSRPTEAGPRSRSATSLRPTMTFDTVWAAEPSSVRSGARGVAAPRLASLALRLGWAAATRCASSTRDRSTPARAMPSARQWCKRATIALWSGSWTRVSVQSGRAGSSGRAISSPTYCIRAGSPSRRAWPTCRVRSKPVSGRQTGRTSGSRERSTRIRNVG